MENIDKTIKPLKAKSDGTGKGTDVVADADLEAAKPVEQDEVSAAVEKKEKPPEPNVIFVGKRTPPEMIQDGMTKYTLPRAKEQLKGAFYHADANKICTLFPKLYKKFQKLSEV